MSHIGFPYVLTLAVLLFVMGIYAALSDSSRRGVAGGAYLMLSGVCVGALGFASFLPNFFAKPWTGYAIAFLVLAFMVQVGFKGMKEEG